MVEEVTNGQDLSSYAAFDIDDLLAEIKEKETSKKEVTAYLDRDFIIKSLDAFKNELKFNKQEFTIDNQLDFTDYNFTGSDLTGFTRKDLDIINFNGCDISSCKLDRISIEYFKEYIKEGKVTYQDLILDNSFLGPTHTKRTDLGIECYVYLNLSNMNLAGTSFRKADIEGLILFNTNISNCIFIDTINMDAKQFAFSMGFETAKFYKNEEENKKFIAKIKAYSESLNPDEYYQNTSSASGNKFIAYLAKMTNIIDD